MKIIFGILIFSIAVLHFAGATIGPDDKKSKTKTKAAEKIKLADKSVLERNLVKKEIDIQNDFVKNHQKYCKPCATQKTFENKVLGYVTPWNSKGYDISKMFAKKLDFISPVWLQVKRTGRKKYELAEHDIDSNWMKQVRENNGSAVSFVPRILFEKFQAEDLHALFNNEDEIQALTKMLVTKAKQFNFEGYVFEIYLQLGGNAKAHINHLIRDMSNALHENGKVLIIVIPPPLANLKTDQKKQQKPVFNKDDFDSIKDLVDGFSLMTYDYASHNGVIAPNAPIDWIEENVKYFTDSPKYRQKILLGLNFYGMKYGLDNQNVQPEPIVGSSLIDLMKSKDANVKLDDKSDEHMFIFEFDSSRVLIFYPTLYSIQQRIELAKRLGTGISIWELGQGLDYFYDLF